MTEGHKVTYGFTQQDEETASAILNGDVMNNTRLDHGFVRQLINADYGAVHSVNFSFLDKVISHFSLSQNRGDVDAGQEFSTYKSRDKNNYTKTFSADVQPQPFKPDIVNNNSV